MVLKKNLSKKNVTTGGLEEKSSNSPIISLLGHVFLELLERHYVPTRDPNTIWQIFIAIRVNDKRIRGSTGRCVRGGL